MSEPALVIRGTSTADTSNVGYRLAKLRRADVLEGRWLDLGCADGGYTRALAGAGADVAFGVELQEEVVRSASPRGAYVCASSDRLPFRDARFDGVLLNEVLEHVDDERATLTECLRVVRPGGHLALMSPNRWFPFEGHGAVFGAWTLDAPAPLVPWLPRSLGHRLMRARNYWPHELVELVTGSGFVPVHTEGVLPVFETFPWLPESLIRRYRNAMPRLDRSPAARMGVSTFVLARRPDRRAAA